METIKERLKTFFIGVEFEQKCQTQRDIANVALSATLLQISEFEFFKKAYYQWYAEELDESALEYIFARYMFEDDIPHYVRNFARKILCLFHQGILDPAQFDIHRPESTPELRSAGIGYTAILIIVVVIFCLLIADYIPSY